MVRYVDKIVGQLVSELDSLGIRERTIVFFASDNGTDKLITGSLKGKRGGEAEALDSIGTWARLYVSA